MRLALLGKLILLSTLVVYSVPAGTLFFEDFSDNSAGWTLGTNWQIGAATAGCGDPGSDADGTAGGGVAGVVLGGCAPTSPLHDYYFLTSPVLNIAGSGPITLSFYRDLYSDYTPYMKNLVQVYDGVVWNTVYETFGSPGVDDTSWQYLEYDITAYANANLQVRWGYNIASSGVFSRGSWNVDNVMISDTTEIPEPSTFLLATGAFALLAVVRMRKRRA
jgi:hypothetical protein